MPRPWRGNIPSPANRWVFPDEELLAGRLARTQRALVSRWATSGVVAAFYVHDNMRINSPHVCRKRENPVKSTSDTSKRPVNLSINARTLDLAKELGMNLSQTVDSFLTAEVQRRYWERWNDDNKDAIDAYNARIEQEGLPLARYRGF